MNAVNRSQVGRRSPTMPVMDPAIQIDGASPTMTASQNMKRSLAETAAFSLVEVTLALGVAAFCLIAVLGLLPTSLKTQQTSIQQTTANQIISQIFSDLRADLRLPPGLAAHEGDAGFNLHGHWAQALHPDTIYFTQDARQTPPGGVYQDDDPPPPDAVFRVKITYRAPPVETTSLADITVTWPAQVDPRTGTPAGSVTTLVAVNR
jgi:type II secretory pathway pseudopilin PulG